MIVTSLKDLRKWKGLTQAQIAKRCGMTRQRIVEYENGYLIPCYWWSKVVEAYSICADQPLSIDIIDGLQKGIAFDLRIIISTKAFGKKRRLTSTSTPCNMIGCDGIAKVTSSPGDLRHYKCKKCANTFKIPKL